MGCHFLLQCIKVKSESEVAQPCPTLCNPMDCSLQGFSVHGIFQGQRPSNLFCLHTASVFLSASSPLLSLLRMLVTGFRTCLGSLGRAHLKVLFIYLSIFGCTGSSLLRELSLVAESEGLLSIHGAQASHCSGLPCCRAQALGPRAPIVVAPRL